MMLLRKRWLWSGEVEESDVEVAGVVCEHAKVVVEPLSATVSPVLVDFLRHLSKAFEIQKYLEGKVYSFMFWWIPPHSCLDKIRTQVTKINITFFLHPRFTKSQKINSKNDLIFTRFRSPGSMVFGVSPRILTEKRFITHTWN
jgi:hypothetical protein